MKYAFFKVESTYAMRILIEWIEEGRGFCFVKDTILR